MLTDWKLRIISDILFLNVVHNAFSFYIMWRSDEVRTAIREHYGNGYSLHLRAGIVFCLGFLAYYFYLRKIIANPDLLLLAMVGIQFLALQHAFSQAHGLSRLYDHSLKQLRRLTDQEKRRLQTASLWERRFHRIILLGIALRAFWVGGDVYGAKSSVDWAWVSSVGRDVLIFGTLGLFATCFYRPYWRESNHWLFNLRRVWEIIPSYFNPTYIALQRLNHGYEYLAVTATMEKNAKKVRSLKVAAIVFTVFVGARIYFYLHQILFHDRSAPFQELAFTGDLSNVTMLLALTSLAVSLVHYYYDSQIFRFSKPEFRNHVLPLLTAPPAPRSQNSI